jgi:pyruvate-ferredoxin/flavodoxin oxidoreductase
LDASAAKSKVQDFMLSENRFKMLTKSKPEDAKKFMAQAQVDADRRWKFYQFMAQRDMKADPASATASKVASVDQQP